MKVGQQVVVSKNKDEYWTALQSQQGQQLSQQSAIGVQDESDLLRKKFKGSAVLVWFICSLLFFSYTLYQKLLVVQTSPVIQQPLSAQTVRITYNKKQKLNYQGPQGPKIMAQYQKMQSLYGNTFSPPKIIWLYSQSINKTTLQILNIKNIERYAQLNNYTINTVHRKGYQQFLEYEVYQEIKMDILTIQNRKPAYYFPNENEGDIKTLIILTLLQEYGGIYIDDTITLTEPLTWLSSVQQQIYTNQVEKYMSTQFFAFHKAEKSSPLEQPYFRGLQTQTYVRILPALQNNFIATYRRAEFIKQLNSQFKKLLRVSHYDIIRLLYKFTNKQHQHLYGLQSEIRGFLFQISGLLVLQERQKEYDKMGQKQRMYAIDYFGVRSINQLYFNKKIEYMMDARTPNNTYYHFTRVTTQELQIMTGPLKYMVELAPLKDFNYLIEKSQKGDSNLTIYKGSFLEKHLFPNSTKAWIQSMPTAPSEQASQGWTSLPKNVWIFWDAGIKNSTITHQLCTRNIQAICKSSGFTYHEVNQSNLQDYLDQETFQRIKKLLEKSPHRTYSQTFSDFVRLALLIKHGGIYLDASYILLQNLDWLIDITSYPSQHIYNRYGSHPKVLMFFNAQYGNNLYKTTFDHKHHTKANWHLGYQNNFIAAEADSQLIKDWFQQFALYHSMEHSEIKVRFKGCQLGNQAWSTDKWSYLYEMDAIKCVIGRKNAELLSGNATELVDSPASQYYGIWSLNGYNGVQKYRSFSNFQNPNQEENYFTTLFTMDYTTAIIGRPKELTKFFGLASKSLSLFLFSHPQNLDPHSLVSQYLMPFKAADEITKVYIDIPVLVTRSES